MPRITEKGISTPPQIVKEQTPALFTWLSTLQLQFPEISTYEASIDLASINSVTYSEQTFTVSGLTTKDIIVVNPPVLTAGLYLVSYRVSANDALSMVFYNSTGAPINEAAGIYLIQATRI